MFTHMAALMDIIVIIIVITLASTKIGAVNGINVQVPKSQYILAQAQNMLVLTVTGGNAPSFFINNTEYKSLNDVEVALDNYKLESAQKEDNEQILVVLKLDSAVSRGLEQELIDLVLNRGMNCALAAEPQ